MTSPAERYAAARRRAAQAADFPALDEFALELGFDLDDFQREACEALERGSGVLVCAPTGAGKTVVGEFAVHLALRAGAASASTPRRSRRCPTRSTTTWSSGYGAGQGRPAHRRQRDQRRRAGGGDDHRGAAQHALRRLGQRCSGLAYVVMDEVHYLADRFRGAVWEEVIIHLPASVTLVSLSATVSNAEEFADWLVTVRGETEVVVSEHRPVPLWQHMLVGKRMFDLFHDADAAQQARRAPGAAALHPRDAAPAGAERRGTAGRRRPGPALARAAAGRDRRAARPRGRCCRRSCSSSAGPAATPPCSSASPPGCG